MNWKGRKLNPALRLLSTVLNYKFIHLSSSIKIEFPREPSYSILISVIPGLRILPCFLREIILWNVTDPLKTFLIARNHVISAFIINGSSLLSGFGIIWYCGSPFSNLYQVLLQRGLPQIVSSEKIKINSKDSDLWSTVPPSLQRDTFRQALQFSSSPCLGNE